jgi:hypothetical protein
VTLVVGTSAETAVAGGRATLLVKPSLCER